MLRFDNNNNKNKQMGRHFLVNNRRWVQGCLPSSTHLSSLWFDTHFTLMGSRKGRSQPGPNKVIMGMETQPSILFFLWLTGETCSGCRLQLLSLEEAVTNSHASWWLRVGVSLLSLFSMFVAWPWFLTFFIMLYIFSKQQK